MMNLIKTLFLAYLLSTSAFAHTSLALDSTLPTKKRTVLTVAISEASYFPFNYIENGELKGFSVDVLDYFEAHSNYDFEYFSVPWPRGVYLVAQGKVDLILTLFKTPEREQVYHFIEPPYANEVNQLFTLAENNFEFSGQLQQLVPYSIGTVREYSYGKAFDQANQLNKVPALTEEVLLTLLLGKRIDMAISNNLVFNEMASQKKVNNKIRAIKPYISLNPVYIALSKKTVNSKEIKQNLETLTKQLTASTYFQELLNKHQLNF